MKKRNYFLILGILILILSFLVFPLTGCERQSDRVSYNLSLEADNFNVYRQLTVVNQRTDTVLFQMRGNFSVEKEADGDLAVIGEDETGQYYKHFIYLSSEISYVVEQLDNNSVEKHAYEINFNPEMIIPFNAVTID